MYREHARPVCFELISDCGRQRGADALAHFTTPAIERGVTIGGDMDKGIGCEFHVLLFRQHARGYRNADKQAAHGQPRGLQKRAAADG